MSGVPMLPLSRSVDMVARVLSGKLSLLRQLGYDLLGYDLPLCFASNGRKGAFVVRADREASYADPDSHR
jgi:hypothetical protein